MKFQYIPHGTCSRVIDFELNDGKISKVNFLGGCNGNLQGISRLIEGMEATEAITRLKGLNCNGKGTSCPDQLARALEQAMANNQ